MTSASDGEVTTANYADVQQLLGRVGTSLPTSVCPETQKQSARMEMKERDESRDSIRWEDLTQRVGRRRRRTAEGASERTDADQRGPAQGFLLFFRLGVRHPTNKAELNEAGCVTVTTGCQKAIQLRDSIGL